MLLILEGWIDHREQDVIEYLRAENRVLREKLGKKRILLVVQPLAGRLSFFTVRHVVEDARRKAIDDLDRLLFPNVPKFDDSRTSGGFVN